MDLPTSKEDWEEAALAAGIRHLTIHDLELDSASKFRYEQYLLLRVLRISHDRSKFDAARFGLADLEKTAKEAMDNYKYWKHYCRSFQLNMHDKEAIPHLGTFSLVRYYQLQVTKVRQDDDVDSDVIVSPIAHRTRLGLQKKEMKAEQQQEQLRLQMQELVLQTPTKQAGENRLSPNAASDSEESVAMEPPSLPATPISKAERILYAPAKDEQIVNAALLLLLNAITIHFPLSNDWTLHRRAFNVQFKTASFQARTDGYLEDKTSGKVRALIEVKPCVRTRSQVRIQMQEAAQMVAWISDDKQRPSQFPGRHLHISQDRHEIFLTFAEYGKSYLSYIKEGLSPADPEPFLTLHEFGPWDTTNAGHMQELGPIILAFTMRAHQDQRLESRLSAGQGRPGEQKKGFLT
ncbi:hypothetical protein VTN00DRAFT_9636 [Thermoascus crustaceus]|uniref:uncharacterized protein n=1 Tax=Thermoascus crustaceus TaxID=5088 RepID=UPI00374328C3